MKKVLLLLLVLTSLLFKVNAQGNINKLHRMDTAGLHWTEEYGGGNPDNTCDDWGDDVYEYYTGADTLCDGIKYAKLYRYYKYDIGYHAYQYCMNCPCTYYCYGGNYYNDTILMGGLREDSIGRVYFLSFDSIAFTKINNLLQNNHINTKKEIVLYDFSLKVGDSMASSYNGAHYHVTRIDTMRLADSSARRVFGAGYGPGEYIIEGIGSKISLFGSIMAIPFEWDQELICFKKSREYLVSRNVYSGNFYCGYGNCDSVYIYTGTENIAPIDYSITIYPNPTSNYAIIKYNIPNSPNNSIKIYNTLGKKVFEANLPQGSDMKKVDIEALPAGVYAVRLSAGNTGFSRLLIKQ